MPSVPHTQRYEKLAETQDAAAHLKVVSGTDAADRQRGAAIEADGMAGLAPADDAGVRAAEDAVQMPHTTVMRKADVRML